MGIECAYSFWDLYKKAYGRDASDQEREAFYALSQDERNVTVRIWAKRASWETQERTGTDGLTYTAFAPSFSSDGELIKKHR